MKKSTLKEEDLEGFALEVIEGHSKEVRSQQIVPPRFKQVVYQTIDWLLGLKSHLSQLNRIYDCEDVRHIEENEIKIARVVIPNLKKGLPPVFNALNEALQGVSGNIQKASMEYLRTKLKQLIYQGDEPEKITVSQAKENNLVGTNHQQLLSSCLRLYYKEELNKYEVEDRAEYLFRQLSQLMTRSQSKEIHVLIVGAKSVEELMRLIDGHEEIHSGLFSFYVVDQSEVDLKRLENRFSTFNQLNKANYGFKAINNSFEKIILSDDLNAYSFDLIYMASQMNYFDEETSKRSVQFLYSKLSEQGRVIVGAYSLTDPSHLTMMIALDWELIFRTNDEYKIILGDIGNKFSIERQGFTANVFCIIKK